MVVEREWVRWISESMLQRPGSGISGTSDSKDIGRSLRGYNRTDRGTCINTTQHSLPLTVGSPMIEEIVR